ncbi:hypothetical protein A9R01_09900 ['Osedax' symbiont bacterium Rs2_46_30_T18]|nr:hypothetical protein A9R01_09900 ['Osedax' symbiont bacterium Rs2_46_30_T18]
MVSFKVDKQLALPIQQYLQQLQNERRLAENTLVNYRSDLHALLHFVADYRIINWRQLTAKQARAFISDAQRQQLSTASTARLVSSIRGFFDYLRRRQIIDTDLLLGLKLPAPVTIKNRTATIDLKALLDFIVDDFISARDRAMLALISCSGIKVAEVAALDLFSVDFARKALIIDRQGHPAAIINIPENTLAAVKSWFTYRSGQLAIEPALFIAKSGRRLSIRAIQLRIHTRGRKMGLLGLNANQLRHQYSQQLMAAEVNIETISQRLGKAVGPSRQLTEQAGDIKRLLASYNQTHPRAKKR